ANGMGFMNSGSGGLKIVDENTGAVLRTLSPAHAGSTNSGVAVSNGVIYWVAGSYLNAWGLPGGSPSATPTRTPAPQGTRTSTSTATPSATATDPALLVGHV